MDARKHLRGLGWKGEGHSLGKHATGLKKPLLITHKTGLHGLGAKSQKEKQADQWWLNAFDNALKDIGTGKESSLSKVRENGGRGGLYGFFVRGRGLEATFDGESAGTSTPTEDAAVRMVTKVTLPTGDLAEARAKQSKKSKKDSKDKKQKRGEDPVDSHQDEPLTKKCKSSPDVSPEPEQISKPKKSRKKKSKNATPEPQIEDVQDEAVPFETVPAIDSETALPKADREARRRAKEERGTRREEKRRERDQDRDSDDGRKRSKKDKKKQKKTTSQSQDVK